MNFYSFGTELMFRNDGSNPIAIYNADDVYVCGTYIYVMYWLRSSETGTCVYNEKVRSLRELYQHPSLVRVKELEVYG